MTDIDQREREMLIDACRYCGVEAPPGYMLAPFDEGSGPWMVAQRLAQLAALQSPDPNAGEAEAERRGMLLTYISLIIQDAMRRRGLRSNAEKADEAAVKIIAAIRAAAQLPKDEQ